MKSLPSSTPSFYVPFLALIPFLSVILLPGTRMFDRAVVHSYPCDICHPPYGITLVHEAST